MSQRLQILYIVERDAYFIAFISKIIPTKLKSSMENWSPSWYQKYFNIGRHIFMVFVEQIFFHFANSPMIVSPTVLRNNFFYVLRCFRWISLLNIWRLKGLDNQKIHTPDEYIWISFYTVSNLNSSIWTRESTWTVTYIYKYIYVWPL